MIYKEHYRDFLGTLEVKIEDLSKEITAWEEKFETMEEIEYGDDLEYNSVCKESRVLKRVKKYFDNANRWSDFESLKSLKAYVSTIDRTCNSMTEYSKAILPVDGGDLVGVTQSEWDALEKLRYKVSQKYQVWKYFLYFCENGTIQ